jgi:hypothetical protein
MDKKTPRRKNAAMAGCHHLLRLDFLRRRELEFSPKNAVPEATGHTKAIVEIGKVVFKVVLL